MSVMVIDENNREINCDILFTCENDETGKSYIVYTDNSFDEEGNTRIFASTFISDSDKIRLMPIETEEERNAVEAIFEELKSKVNAADDEGSHDER